MTNVGAEVIKMLCPYAEFTIYGDDFDSIIWHKGKPEITKEDYLAGFAVLEQHKTNLLSQQAAEKAAVLDRLGITADEAKLLLN